MKFMVLGAGAIGAWIGANLLKAGNDVIFVGRERFADAVRKDGLRGILPTSEPWRLADVQAMTDVAHAARFGPLDAVIVCVKAYDVEQVIADLKRCPTFTSHTAIVAMQNGIGSEEAFSAAFGAGRIIAGTLTSPVSLDAPNVVRLQRDRGGVALAPLHTGEGVLGFDHIASSFQTAPLLRVKRYADYHAMKWSKLLLNLVGNATGAVFDATVAEILDSDALAKVEMRMLREAERVMRAHGLTAVDLPGAPSAWFARALRWLPDPGLRVLLRRFFARARGDKRPSFYYDAVNQTGRSEVEWLNEAVSRYGREVGVPTPVNDALTRLLLEIVAGKRPLGDATAIQEMVALVR